MTVERAREIFADLGLELSSHEEFMGALQDFHRARQSFTEEEYPAAEHEMRMAAGRVLLSHAWQGEQASKGEVSAVGAKI